MLRRLKSKIAFMLQKISGSLISTVGHCYGYMIVCNYNENIFKNNYFFNFINLSPDKCSSLIFISCIKFSIRYLPSLRTKMVAKENVTRMIPVFSNNYSMPL